MAPVDEPGQISYYLIVLNNSERAELELFGLLYDSQNPTGSVTLSLLLKEKKMDISSATVGRMLAKFDHQRLTARHGFKGRALTADGLKRFTELKNKERFGALASKFYDSVDAASMQNLIDLLVARRGIEQESARLAAKNATGDDRRRLKRLYSRQEKDVAGGIDTPDTDVMFHQAICAAGKNQVLLATYDFIWQKGRFSPAMEYIRKAVGGVLAADHKKIMEAVLARDSDGAAACMAAHIDSLISDVQKYWHLSLEPEKPGK